MLRLIGAVIAGYVAFALTTMVLVGLVLGLDGAIAVVVALIGLAAIGAGVGFLIRWIAAARSPLAALVVCVLVILATTANLLMSLGAEPQWYKVATLLLLVPVLYVVGRGTSTRDEAV